MSTEIEQVNWKTKEPTNIQELLEKYRPQIIRTYIDETLNKEVKVFEPRYC